MIFVIFMIRDDQTNFVSEISFYQPEWLSFVKVGPFGPLQVEQLKEESPR